MVLPFIATAPAAPAVPSTEAHASTHATAERFRRHHTVRTDETASDIARHHRVSTADLLSHNGLASSDFIHPGQSLRIPSSEASRAGRDSTSERPKRSGSTRSYVVRGGDTLSGIATRHDMSVDRLRSLNDLDEGYIHTGTKLRVSGTPTKPEKRSTDRPSATSTITVRDGDTLIGLAKKHDMSTARLAKLNRLSSDEHIRPGGKLKVTTSSTSSESAGSKGGSSSTQRKASSDAEYDHNTFAGRTYSDQVVKRAERNRSTLADRDLPTRQETKEKIRRIAKQHGVDPSLALAISYQESGWSQGRVSVANAVGTMQVIPSSGEWASDMAGRDLDLLDPDDNITAGVLLIKVLTGEASTTSDAIAGYYQGLASVEKNGMYDDTEQYVSNIKSLRQRM